MCLLIVSFFFRETFDISVYEGITQKPPRVIDFNSDGISEILLFGMTEGEMPAYHLKTIEGQYIRQINFPEGEVLFSSLINFDGGVDKELVFSLLKNDSLFIHIEKVSGEKWWRYFITKVKDMRPPEGWIGKVKEGGVFYIKDRNMFLVFVSAGFDLYPRGVFAIDVSTGKMLWKFISGAAPEMEALEDINGDRVPEIVVGSFAPCNGSDFGGFDDFSSYLFVLDLDGNLLFHHIIGDYSTTARFILGEPEIDNSRKIYVAECNGLRNAGSNERFVYVIDGKTGRIIKKRKFYEGISKFERVDIDGDGISEYMVYFFSGNLVILDKDLNIVKEKKLPQGINYLKAEDMDFDGLEEIISAGATEMALYNRNFRLLGKAEMGGFTACSYPSIPILLRGKEGKGIILYSKSEGKYRIYMFRYKRIFNYSFAIVLLGLFIVFGFFYTGLKMGRRMGESHLLLYFNVFPECAHKLKNLLQEIGNFLQKKGEESEIQTYRKIQEILAFLSAYFSMVGVKVRKAEVNRVVEKVVNAFQKITEGRIVFEKHLDRNVKYVKISPHHLEVILRNLIQNAVEAMDRGRVIVETVRRRKMVEIKVRDEGRGILIPKNELFEPFKTTKDGHLGLGLYIVRNLVHLYHGRIEVESIPEKGTSFRILLPV